MALVYRLKPGQNSGAVNVIDTLKEINGSGLDHTTKRQMIRSLRRVNAATFLVVTDSAFVTSTTLADYAEFYVQCVRGRWYEVEANLAFTNGTAANGAKAAFNLTGTQTSAVVSGSAGSSLTATAADSSGAVASVAISTNTLITGTADTTSPYYINLKFRFKPGNDGVLTLQLAEKDTGGGTLVLKAGSTVTIRELA